MASVSRPAALLPLKLRGRLEAVPVNGCLVPLTRGPLCEPLAGKAWQQRNHLRRLRKPRSGVLGNLRFPLTNSYHGCPPFLSTKFPPPNSCSSRCPRSPPLLPGCRTRDARERQLSPETWSLHRGPALRALIRSPIARPPATIPRGPSIPEPANHLCLRCALSL